MDSPEAALSAGQLDVECANCGATAKPGFSSASEAFTDRHIWAQSGMSTLPGRQWHGMESHGVDCAAAVMPSAAGDWIPAADSLV